MLEHSHRHQIRDEKIENKKVKKIVKHWVKKSVAEIFHIAEHFWHARTHGILFLWALHYETTTGLTSVNQEINGETRGKLSVIKLDHAVSGKPVIRWWGKLK